MLGLIVLNRILVKSYEEVKDARQCQAWSEHLRKGTVDEPQPANPKCPFGNKYEIECLCVDDGPSARFKPTFGANLLIVPPNLVAHWLAQASLHLIEDERLGVWNVRHGYTNPKMNRLVPRLDRIKDRQLLELNGANTKRTAYHPDASATIVATTKLCCTKHTFKTFDQSYVPPKLTPRSRPKPQTIGMNFAWSRVCVDEAHLDQSTHSTGILLVKGLGKHLRKWFVTGTPFETSPDQVASWIATLEDGWDSPLTSQDRPWPRQLTYRNQLKECTPQKVKELGAIHRRLMKNGEIDQRLLLEHARKVSILLNTL